MSDNVEICINPKESQKSDLKSEEINIKTYISAKIALPTMMDEYTKERERAGIIDTKAIALITILLALVTVYLPITPFEKVKTIYVSGTKNQIIGIVITITIFLAALIVTGYTFYTLINIVKLRTYKRVEIDNMLKDEELVKREDLYTAGLCDHYLSLILQNSESNDNKSKRLNMCYVLTVISFILLLLSCILMKVI